MAITYSNTYYYTTGFSFIRRRLTVMNNYILYYMPYRVGEGERV